MARTSDSGGQRIQKEGLRVDKDDLRVNDGDPWIRITMGREEDHIKRSGSISHNEHNEQA